MSKKMNLIMENWRKFVNEDADPTKIPDDKFPLLLSAVKAEIAKNLVASGEDAKDKGNQDDVVAVESGKPFSCELLKPSQTSMNINKAWQFALSMMNNTMPGSKGPGGELGSFISKDFYIMDGHHRWIATGMVNPKAEITGYYVNLPGEKLVRVLNTVTKGLLNPNEAGNPGTGGFEQFKDANALKQALELQINKGAGKEQGPIGGKPEDILNILMKWTGSKDQKTVVDTAIQKVIANLQPLLDSPIMPNAPDRKDMPVIDDKKVSNATKNTIDALTQGKIDLNPPFASAAAAPAVQKESLKKLVRQVIRENLKRR